uniref:Uncharacterized protein n=1 Tax=Rhizophora mucronata TaxID=61149 RepID=A0A2P2QFF5_RHIMU
MPIFKLKKMMKQSHLTSTRMLCHSN